MGHKEDQSLFAGDPQHSTRRKDITGKRFGRLVALMAIGKSPDNSFIWLCECDCGTKVAVGGCALRRGTKQSCGCLWLDSMHARATHGMTGTKTYQAWIDMHRRCHDKDHPAFKDYGDRGIEVCMRWCHFENFVADMGICPDGLTLDRISNDGGYSPLNCRWTTMREQSRNRRTNRHLTFNGQTKTYVEWSEITGLKQNTIAYRVTHGWPIDKVLTTGANHG